MKTFRVTLPADLAQWVTSRVTAGEYASVSEAALTGLRILFARENRLPENPSRASRFIALKAIQVIGSYEQAWLWLTAPDGVLGGTRLEAATTRTGRRLVFDELTRFTD